MKTDYWGRSSQNNPQRIWTKIYHWKDQWQQSCRHAVIHISSPPRFGGWQTEVINIFTARHKSSLLVYSQSCLWPLIKVQSDNKGCVRSSRLAKELTAVLSRAWEASGGLLMTQSAPIYKSSTLPGVTFTKIYRKIFMYLTNLDLWGSTSFRNNFGITHICLFARLLLGQK